jgi:RNA-binding protein
MAHDIKSEVRIGKNGINDNVIEAAEENIKKNELLKVKVFKDAATDKQEASKILSRRLNAEVVRIIGNKIILFRQKESNSRYHLPS